MAKSIKSNPPADVLPDLPNYDSIPADGLKIGDSPIPGLTLKRILRGHTNTINRIAWSPDGSLLASPSGDGRIRIWDVAQGECIAVLEKHFNMVKSVAWSPNGHRLASGSADATIRIWDTQSWQSVALLKHHSDHVNSVAWSPDGHKLASGSADKTIRIWKIKPWKTLTILEAHTNYVVTVAWSPDGDKIASSSYDKSVIIWNALTGSAIHKLKEHPRETTDAVWVPNSPHLISSCYDGVIRLWNVQTGKLIQKLEGHTSVVKSLSLSAGGAFLASYGGKEDQSIRLWHTNTWQIASLIKETTTNNWPPGIAFHPSLPRLSTLGEKDTLIRIWDLDADALLGQTAADSVHYTTAKLVLVGDSGVGKTGLGWRLAHGEFKEHPSTHGQQFWVMDELSTTRSDGAECEAVLWDLAGQHVYRPIHAIFLDDVDASMVLFDPTNRQDPLKGAEFWLEQLAHKKELPPSVLVGARLDRGAAVLSREELTQFCQRHRISGGYIGTSAKEGLGLDELLESLKTQIPWDQMTTTVTTRTFKRVKEYVLSLKEKPDRKHVLVKPAALRGQLEASDPDWKFSDAEMMTAVGHLQTHGYASVLRSSSGQEHILLTPELLVDLASSIVLQADKHPRELGALNETDLLQGHYPLPELKDLEPREQPVLLDAAVARFLEHNICFRETLGNDTLLIFPGLIKQKRPLHDDVEAVEDISYIVRGRVENIYSALVVLLGFTRTFTRVNQWQRQAQYEMGEGNICGFRLIEDVEGEIELVLYYSATMPDYGRRQFRGLFEEFLYKRDVEVTRFPPVMCPDRHLQERGTVIKRLREGKPFLFCEECGKKIHLPDIKEQPAVDAMEVSWIQREEALVRLRSAYETHLTRIKGYRRDRAAPRCYISFLPAQAKWAGQLTEDLRDAGAHIILDRDDLADNDLILIADTPDYQRSFKDKAEAIAGDAALIRDRLEKSKKSTIVHLLVESRESAPKSGATQLCDFRRDSHYAVSLFNLVLKLYAIAHNHPAFSPLRDSLRRQWEETLGKFSSEETSPSEPLKIFISYAHEDEGFKDELVVMLASMQRRGIIDAWQDRRIEAGEEWYWAIQRAMKDCDIAILLVSNHFLASRFIQDEEVPRLLQRRRDEGMRVVPIIIRPCTWDSEPALQDLQALPQDGKAVITFSKETGERDQVWTDIAKAIERQSKTLPS